MFYTDQQMEHIVRQRLEQIHTDAPGSVGDMMNFELVSCNPKEGLYRLRCKTLPWMRNIAGTLHGGLCATILDQSMGFISYCIKPGEGTSPTVQLQVNYHRPIIPEDWVLVEVRVLSVSKSLMHLSAQAFREENPEKLCLSGSAVFFYKSAE